MPNSGATIAVNRPLVVSETLNGESIIMHHGTGHYFNTVGSGALIWQAIEGGTTLGGIVTMLAASFGIDDAQAREAAAPFIDQLGQHGLIMFGDELPSNPIVASRDASIFAAPELGVHEDLADMLLLDPIHDVDEVGWPAPRQFGAAE